MFLFNHILWVYIMLQKVKYEGKQHNFGVLSVQCYIIEGRNPSPVSFFSVDYAVLPIKPEILFENSFV